MNKNPAVKTRTHGTARSSCQKYKQNARITTTTVTVISHWMRCRLCVCGFPLGWRKMNENSDPGGWCAFVPIRQCAGEWTNGSSSVCAAVKCEWVPAEHWLVVCCCASEWCGKSCLSRASSRTYVLTLLRVCSVYCLLCSIFKWL